MVNRLLSHAAMFCLAIMLMTTPALAANITAKLDRNPVRLDESFHLIYEADSNVDDPDFSALYKDFEILNSSQSTNMRAANGNWSLKKSWDLALMSKQAGVFTIPPVPFGNEMSPALRITVRNSGSSTAPKKPGDPGADIFIEVDTDVKQAWMRQQIIYTIRLFSNVPVGRPTLSQPETDDPDTIFFKLGEVSNYEAFRNGERYAVSELKFAAFAQHSGELTFKPVLFEGLIATGQPRSLFDAFNQRGITKRLRSKPVTVKINPIPANQDANQWLPASQLTLVEEWSSDIRQLKAGEPVTRTISLIARGLTAEQLPDIKIIDVPGLKQYPDQASLSNDHSSSGVTGTRIMKTALIPGQSGDYTLPALQISWWNTTTGKAEVATLPAEVLHVSGVANILANPPAAQAPAKTDAPGTAVAVTPATTADSDELMPAAYWRWLSLGLGSAWIVTLILSFWLRQRQPRRADKPPALHRLASSVQKHAAANRPAETRQALIDWARVRWPEAQISNLADVAQHCHAGLGKTIRELNVALYSAAPERWQGQALAAAFNQYRNASAVSRPGPKSALEPLYK